MAHPSSAGRRSWASCRPGSATPSRSKRASGRGGRSARSCGRRRRTEARKNRTCQDRASRGQWRSEDGCGSRARRLRARLRRHPAVRLHRRRQGRPPERDQARSDLREKADVVVRFRKPFRPDTVAPGTVGIVVLIELLPVFGRPQSIKGQVRRLCLAVAHAGAIGGCGLTYGGPPQVTG
jgi:hypothetical protein